MLGGSAGGCLLLPLPLLLEALLLAVVICCTHGSGSGRMNGAAAWSMERRSAGVCQAAPRAAGPRMDGWAAAAFSRQAGTGAAVPCGGAVGRHGRQPQQAARQAKDAAGGHMRGQRIGCS